MDLFGNEDPEEYVERHQQELKGKNRFIEDKTLSFHSHDELKVAITSCKRCALRGEGGLGHVLSPGPVYSPLLLL